MLNKNRNRIKAISAYALLAFPLGVSASIFSVWISHCQLKTLVVFPGNSQGVLCLDDLRALNVIAIVEPMGEPKVVERLATFQDEKVKKQVKFISVEFKVLDSYYRRSRTVQALLPIEASARTPIESVHLVIPPERYLLFAGGRRGSSLGVSKFFQISRIERSKKWQVYTVDAKSENEFAGMSLIDTHATVLHDANSIEETALLSAADAVASSPDGEAYDAVTFFSRISRYSLRTESIYSVNERAVSAGRDLVGEMPTEKYFSDVLSPIVLQKFNDADEGREKRLLNTLSKWGSSEAVRRLKLIPPKYD